MKQDRFFEAVADATLDALDRFAGVHAGHGGGFKAPRMKKVKVPRMKKSKGFKMPRTKKPKMPKAAHVGHV